MKTLRGGVAMIVVEKEVLQNVIDTLALMTSNFITEKFCKADDLEGLEFSTFRVHRYFIFKPYQGLVKRSYGEIDYAVKHRITLIHNDGVVVKISDIPAGKTEAFLVEVGDKSGDDVFYELVELHYYVDEEEPDKEPLGYVKLKSNSYVGILGIEHTYDLVDALVSNWNVRF
jgi:hypothetical protein